MWVLLVAAGVAAGSRAEAPWPAMHPMHTAVAEISYLPASRTASIVIRVFADDFAAALGLHEGNTPDSAMSRYVRGTFALADRCSRPLRIRWVGAERAGDIVVLRLWVGVPDGLAHAKVFSALLSERFEDQVNIVRAVYDGRATTLLFTRGEPAKTLP